MRRIPFHVVLSVFLLASVLAGCSGDAAVAAVIRPRLRVGATAVPAVVPAVVAAGAVGRRMAPVRVRPLQPPAPIVVPAPAGPVTEVQSLLARLGYLPLRWSAPQRGFAWRWRHVPATLRHLWTPGVDGVMTQAALTQFLRDAHLPATAAPGGMTAVASALRQALAKHQTDPHPYTYVLVSQGRPETLSIWRDGRVVLSTMANTGATPTTTAVGSFAVYLRYRSQAMRGVGPDGLPYDYPHVMWVSYFHGGDAIHAFPRAAYGFPQSAGCVELPPDVAEAAWDLIGYGTLVTVLPPAPRQPV